MKILIIILILMGVMFTGCLTNPTKEVPIVKVNISFKENNSIVEATNYTLDRGTVSYLNRPMATQAKNFPSIGARTTIMKGKNSTFGPWEMVPYTGDGSWIEGTLQDMKKCLMSDTVPKPSSECDYCLYRKASRDVQGKKKKE